MAYAPPQPTIPSQPPDEDFQGNTGNFFKPIDPNSIAAANTQENNFTSGRTTTGTIPTSPNTLGDLTTAARLRPDIAKKISDPASVMDAPSLLAYLHSQGAGINQAKSDPIDSTTMAHFNTDEASGSKVQQVLRDLQQGREQQDPNLQTGFLRLANGDTSVLFAPGNTTSTNKSVSDTLNSLTDPEQKAVYTQAVDQHLQALRSGQSQLSDLSTQAEASRSNANNLQQRANSLMSQARGLQAQLGSTDDPNQQQYYQRQADQLQSQAQQLITQSGEYKTTANEFLQRQQDLSDQLDDFKKRIPDAGQAAVDRLNGQRQFEVQMAQTRADIRKQNQTSPVLRIAQDRRSALTQVNTELAQLIKRKTVENPLVPPKLTGDNVKDMQAMQQARDKQQLAINNDNGVKNLMGQKQFYENDLKRLQPGIDALTNQNAEDSGIDLNTARQHIIDMGGNPDDPKIQQAMQDVLNGAQ